MMDFEKLLDELINGEKSRLDEKDIYDELNEMSEFLGETKQSLMDNGFSDAQAYGLLIELLRLSK